MSENPLLQEIFSREMPLLEAVVRKGRKSSIPMIEEITQHVGMGGKKLRSMVLILAARAAGYEGDLHYRLAASIEEIHNATLLHDDIVDHSLLRRGKASVNAVFGEQAAVLVGDFLYTRAFRVLVEARSFEILEVLVHASSRLAEGGMMELAQMGNYGISEEDCLEIAQRKTAALFAAASEIGAIVAGLDGRKRQGLAHYGHCLGMAFQIMDDLLDYTGSEKVLGKSAGSDLEEGKPTLPLIRLFACGDPQALALRERLMAKEKVDLAEALLLLEKNGALGYVRQKADAYARAACESLGFLPPSPHVQALAEIAHWTVAR